jgi:DNA end-binding protein Ku
VLAMIEARAAGKEIPAGEPVRPAASNVVNLMDVLQRSLEASSKGRGSSSRHAASDDESAAEEKKASAGRKKSASAAKPRRKKSAA